MASDQLEHFVEAVQRVVYHLVGVRQAGVDTAAGQSDEAVRGVGGPHLFHHVLAALAVGGGVRWNAVRGVRVYVDFEHTSFDGGAAAGADRPAEDVVLTRVQTVF